MLWFILALLVLVAGFALRRQRRSYPVEREPWEGEPEDDAPLDMEEIRRAEEEWETEASWDEPPEEDWR